MKIEQKPAALNFSGNLIDILISDLTEAVTLELSDSSGLLLQEKYTPFAGKVRIRLKDIIHSLLEVEIPNYNDKVFVQNKGWGNFSVKLTSATISETITFIVIKGFLQKHPFDVELFVRQNWLTFQPRNKAISFHDPEWLSCFPTESSSIIITGTFENGQQQTVTYANLSANKLQAVRLQFGDISSLFSQDLVSFTVWSQVSNQIRQYEQSYTLQPTPYLNSDIFVFENRLGGIDSIRFNGQKKYHHSTDFEAALMDEDTNEFFADPTLTIEKETGFLKSKSERLLALDFFRSKNKYHVLGGRPVRITTKNLQLESTAGELINYSFNFEYSGTENTWPEFGISHQNTLIF